VAVKKSGARRARSSGGGEPPDGGYPGGEEEPQGPGNPDANPARIHREYVERRVGGGAPPTADRYREALRQWNALPGSIRIPPSESPGESDEADSTADAGSSATGGGDDRSDPTTS